MSADMTRTREPEDNEWLPRICPHWCEGGHEQSIAEGND